MLRCAPSRSIADAQAVLELVLVLVDVKDRNKLRLMAWLQQQPCPFGSGGGAPWQGSRRRGCCRKAFRVVAAVVVRLGNVFVGVVAAARPSAWLPRWCCCKAAEWLQLQGLRRGSGGGATWQGSRRRRCWCCCTRTRTVGSLAWPPCPVHCDPARRRRRDPVNLVEVVGRSRRGTGCRGYRGDGCG